MLITKKAFFYLGLLEDKGGILILRFWILCTKREPDRAAKNSGKGAQLEPDSWVVNHDIFELFQCTKWPVTSSWSCSLQSRGYKWSVWQWSLRSRWSPSPSVSTRRRTRSCPKPFDGLDIVVSGLTHLVYSRKQETIFFARAPSFAAAAFLVPLRHEECLRGQCVYWKERGWQEDHAQDPDDVPWPSGTPSCSNMNVNQSPSLIVCRCCYLGGHALNECLPQNFQSLGLARGDSFGTKNSESQTSYAIFRLEELQNKTEAHFCGQWVKFDR